MRHAKFKGFTLIELMVTVAIVAILAAIALASYRSHIVRANRSAAESYMQQLASMEERFLLDNRKYSVDVAANDGLGFSTLTGSTTLPSNVSGNYTIAITGSGGVAPDYTITASPQGAQATDDTTCGPVTLNSQGVKTPAASGATARCWQ